MSTTEIPNSEPVKENPVVEEEAKRMRSSNLSVLIDPSYVSLINTDTFYKGNISDPVGRVVKKTISHKDFISKITKANDVYATGKFLPANCRYFKNIPNSDFTTIVIEEQPQLRTVNFHMDISRDIETLKKTGAWDQYGYTGMEKTRYNPSDGKYTYKYRLSFPFTVYVITLKSNCFYNMTVFFRLAPISGLNDYLLMAPLLNIPEEQKICLGSGWRKMSSRNASEEVSQIIEQFWNGVFNRDYTYNYEKYKDVYELNNYFAWQYFSKVDPMFIFKVKWHQWEHNLSSELKRMEGYTREYGNSPILSYNNIINILTGARLLAEDEVPENITRGNTPYENFCNDVFVGNGNISIGDDINIDGKKMFVTSFIGISGSSSPSHIVLTDESGTSINVVYDSTLKKKLNSIFESKERSPRSCVLPIGDVKIKVGDLVEFSYGESFKGFKKVENIRIGLDNKTHIKLGNDYFFSDTLKVKIVDFSQGVKLKNGTTIKEGENLTLARNFGGIYNVNRLLQIKVDKFTVLNDRLAVQLIYDNGFKENHYIDDLNINTIGEAIDPSIMDLMEVKDKVLRVGQYLLKVEGNNLISKVLINPENSTLMVSLSKEGERNGYSSLNGVMSDCSYFEPTDILLDKSQRLYIPSYDGVDIDLKVGDKVVVGKWMNSNFETGEHTTIPATEILKVRIVQGFTYNDDTMQISVLTIDPITNQTTSYNYVSVHEKKIQIGLIRKVVTEMGSYSSGDYVKAITKGIPDFPMKDTVSIVAFIVDTGMEPMVLCSNGSTVWFSDLKKHFAKSPGKATAIDPTLIRKFPVAPGNMFLTNNRSIYPCIIMELVRGQSEADMMTREGIQRPKLVNVFNQTSVATADSYLETFAPFGIPNPRLGPSEYMSKPLSLVVPTFHGGYVKSKNSNFGVRTTKLMN